MRSKSELYCLVAELRGYGFRNPTIAARLRITVRRVEQVVADMRQPEPADAELPALLLERITHFAKRNDS